MALNTIIKEQLKKIDYEDESSVVKAMNFVELLKKTIKKQKINAEVVIGGSLAKGTQIRENFDVDIFVKFDKAEKKNISDLLEKIIKGLKVKYERVHGSRDYFHIKKDLFYEIVPVLNVDNWKEAENVSDMSPLHVEYFVKKIKNKKTIRNEIRITKQFMKSARVYGAESYIRGFSGHVVDLLIINYGSFKNLVEKASKWKDRKIIDIEKHHVHPMMSLNQSKLQSPLVVVDPIQVDRNASAALSEENYKIFIKTCKLFLKKPSKKFFEEKPFSDVINEAKKKFGKKSKFIEMNLIPLNEKEDVAGSKVLKVKEFIEKELEKHEFKIYWRNWEFDKKKSTIIFAVDKKILPEIKINPGPEKDMGEHVKVFKKKYKNIIVKKGKLYAKVKRKYRTADKLIADICKGKYVKDKVRKIISVSKE